MFLLRNVANNPLIISVTPSYLEHWSTLKGNNLLPYGSKFCPFRVDLNSEGR